MFAANKQQVAILSDGVGISFIVGPKYGKNQRHVSFSPMYCRT
ncbi:hypothetical protein EJP617_26990 [Erwinia sp. Ejp617]|nr:hypothetical protein EJP617_26990 [Erwinia sp. Ejp617]